MMPDETEQSRYEYAVPADRAETAVNREQRIRRAHRLPAVPTVIPGKGVTDGVDNHADRG